MKTMIIGSGISGLAVAECLSQNNQEYFFAKKEDIDAEKFNDLYIEYLLKDVKEVILSPGINPKREFIFQIKKRKIKITGELEFATSQIFNDIIAITGTNGKTTSVSLMYFLLKELNLGVYLGGNVGVPVTGLIKNLNGNELLILEVSSFQLETVKKFRPNIAVILNISEDHLNRHSSMREYIRCKYNITKNQTTDDYLLLNADDTNIQKHPPRTNAKIYYFSTKQKVEGSYIKNNCIYFNDNEKEIKLASLSEIKLKGEHNLSNILAVSLAIYLKFRNKDFLKGLPLFTGVPHRIEFVTKINGVDFYNDSKATTISSTMAAIESFCEPINLILGGSDKGYSFDELFKKLPRNVKNIAVFGQTKNKIALSAKMMNYNNIYFCDDLEMAIRTLFKLSKRGDVLLLSPACASFDFFSNFEERGNVFKKIVREIKINESS